MNQKRLHSDDSSHLFPAGPKRICVGCRRVDLQQRLLRCILKNQTIIWDQGKRGVGRGAYVHAVKQCLLSAEKNGFSRSFRSKISTKSIMSIHEHILKQDMVREGSK